MEGKEYLSINQSISIYLSIYLSIYTNIYKDEIDVLFTEFNFLSSTLPCYLPPGGVVMLIVLVE